MNALRNKIQLIGRLGMDPIMKDFGNGKALVRFSLATRESYKTKDGKWENETHWFDVIAWGKTASLIDKLASKGDEVAVEGKLVTRTYEDKKGETRKVTEVVVNDFLLMTQAPEKQAA